MYNCKNVSELICSVFQFKSKQLASKLRKDGKHSIQDYYSPLFPSTCSSLLCSKEGYSTPPPPVSLLDLSQPCVSAEKQTSVLPADFQIKLAINN